MRHLLALLAALLIALPCAAAPPSNSTGVYSGHVTPAGCAYLTESCTLFAQMTSSPDATRKGLINTAIGCLQSNSLWTKEDWIVVMAAGNQHDALLDWANPSKTLSVVGSVTFTTDLGFKLTASSVGNHLLFPELLNAGTNLYALNDAHFSVYVNAFAFKNFSALISSGSNNYNTSLGQQNATNAFFGSINTTAITLTTGVDATASNYIGGAWTMSRTGMLAQALYKAGPAVNGANSWTGVEASTAVPGTSEWPLGGEGSLWDPPSTSTQMAYLTTGNSFSSTNAANESTCLKAYLDAIGAG